MVKPNGKLWAAIRAKGLFQRDFAKIVGDDEAVVSRAVTGRLNLDEARKIRYARALGLRPEELFGNGEGARQ